MGGGIVFIEHIVGLREESQATMGNIFILFHLHMVLIENP